MNITTEGDKVRLAFQYDPPLVTAVKSIPGRRFDPNTKSWSIPLSSLDDAITALGACAPALIRLREQRQNEAAAAAAYNAEKAQEAYDRIPHELLSKLYPHQREAVRFVLGSQQQHKGVLIGDDMGLGKTRTAIVAAQTITTLPCMEPRTVVVCPAAVKMNWAREIRLALGNLTQVQIIRGGKSTVDPEARWTIINYDILIKHVGALGHPTVLIVDESQYAKEGSSARTKATQLLAARAKRTLLLSGTPMKNRARELIAQLEMLRSEVVEDKWGFLHRYCDPQPNPYAHSGYTFDGCSHMNELRKRLSTVWIARKKGDVLDLPAKLRAFHPIEIDQAQYDDAMVEARREARERMAAGEILDSANALSILTRERVATSRAKVGATIDLVAEILDGSTEKVIVFCAFTDALKAIAAAFPGSLTLDGSTTSEERQGIVDRFQSDPAVRLIACNIIAGGVGITLTAATQVVMHDLVWTPADHVQAEDRAHRIGQGGTVNVTYVVGQETIDETLSAALEQKMANISEFEGVAQQSLLGELMPSIRDWLKAERKAERKATRTIRKARKAEQGYTYLPWAAFGAMAAAIAVAVLR